MLRIAPMLLGLCLCVMAGTATADSPEKRAHTLYSQGKAQLTSGEFAEAVATFSRAWAVFEHPLILKKRAEAKEQLGDIEEAITDYRLYDAKLWKYKKKERRLVAEQIRLLSALLDKPVKVSVVATRVGVKVAVDGGEGRRTPFDEHLTPGKHQFTVADGRFEGEPKIVRVKAARPMVVKLMVSSRTAQVTVKSSRGNFTGMTVAVDGETIPLSESERTSEALPPREMDVGPHQLVCTVPEMPTFYVDFQVVAGQPVAVTCVIPVPIRSVAGDAWGWTVAGVGLASLAAGTGLLISWASDVQLAKDTNRRLVTSKDIAGGVLMGVVGACAIVAPLVFLRDELGGSDNEAAWVPGVLVLPTAERTWLSATWTF